MIREASVLKKGSTASLNELRGPRDASVKVKRVCMQSNEVVDGLVCAGSNFQSLSVQSKYRSGDLR